MKLSTLRRSRTHRLPGITAVARVDRRTKSLVKRLLPGEIAVVDCVDMDRATAVALVQAGAVAVVNAAPTISGRYPNLGPRYLLDAGVVLVDDVGGQLMTAVHDGQQIRVDQATVYIGEDVIGTGQVQDRRRVERSMEEAKQGIPTQLEAVSAHAVEHLRHENRMFLDRVGIPMLATPVKGRHAVVVDNAFDARRELASLKAYLRENSPVLIGVDAGADVLLEAGRRPDIVVCDPETVSDAALRCGAEIVVKTGPDGRVAAGDRIARVGVRHLTFATECSAEDAALLLAQANLASLIVTVGLPSALDELLDTGRSSMASSFLTRATVGSHLADAKAVSALYASRMRGFVVLLLVLLAIAAVAASIATTPVGQDWTDQVRTWLSDGYDWVRGQVT